MGQVLHGSARTTEAVAAQSFRLVERGKLRRSPHANAACFGALASLARVGAQINSRC